MIILKLISGYVGLQWKSVIDSNTRMTQCMSVNVKSIVTMTQYKTVIYNGNTKMTQCRSFINESNTGMTQWRSVVEFILTITCK